MAEGKVLVVMGSDSDFPVMEGCFKMLKKFGVEFEADVASAHRTPLRAQELAVSAEENGFKVIIAVAGLAAHLAGVLAETIGESFEVPVEVEESFKDIDQ